MSVGIPEAKVAEASLDLSRPGNRNSLRPGDSNDSRGDTTMPCIHVDKDAKIIPHPASGKGHERGDVHDRIDELAKKVQPKVAAWRQDIHQNPELSNREFRTAKVVADHLKSLKLDDDASRFIRAAGGMYVMIGTQNVTFGEGGKLEGDMVPNHNEKYYVVDAGMELGVRAHAYVTMDFLSSK